MQEDIGIRSDGYAIFLFLNSDKLDVIANASLLEIILPCQEGPVEQRVRSSIMYDLLAKGLLKLNLRLSATLRVITQGLNV